MLKGKKMGFSSFFYKNILEFKIGHKKNVHFSDFLTF